MAPDRILSDRRPMERRRTGCRGRLVSGPARFSHHLPAEARDRAVITALRLPAVLTVLFKYASARQAARALS